MRNLLFIAPLAIGLAACGGPSATEEAQAQGAVAGAAAGAAAANEVLETRPAGTLCTLVNPTTGVRYRAMCP